MSYALPAHRVIPYPPSRLEGFHLYRFEWIDNLNFIRDPADLLGADAAAAYVACARHRFVSAGWQGDGEIGLLWLPTFVFPDGLEMEPEGVVVWHVKQDHLGISFLLSPVELPFAEVIPVHPPAGPPA